MAIISFPPVTQADRHGLLAVGGDLEVPSLVLAYSQGIFPWPISEEVPLAWFSPNPRGVLDYADLYCNRSLKKFLQHCPYRVTFNQAFETVIKSCAQVHGSRGSFGTWITSDIVQAYIDMFHAGLAYSVEVYDLQDQSLVGGLYGVCLGTLVSGESMFYRKPNASKLALWALMQQLHSRGVEWLDTQMVTPVVGAMGGKEIARKNFLARVKERKQVDRSALF